MYRQAYTRVRIVSWKDVCQSSVSSVTGCVYGLHDFVSSMLESGADPNTVSPDCGSAPVLQVTLAHNSLKSISRFVGLHSDGSLLYSFFFIRLRTTATKKCSKFWSNTNRCVNLYINTWRLKVKWFCEVLFFIIIMLRGVLRAFKA
jgi:hypothetical protein